MAAVVVLLLSPAILFPVSPDTGLYFVSGWKILGGGLHYRDIVDLKPPPIYYLYALAGLFGRNAIAFRLLDFLLQCATCLLLARAVRRFVARDADPSRCVQIGSVGREHRYECRETECQAACGVVHVITVLGERRGRWRRVSQRREDLGDTGECGCCDLGM